MHLLLKGTGVVSGLESASTMLLCEYSRACPLVHLSGIPSSLGCTFMVRVLSGRKGNTKFLCIQHV